MKSSRTEMRFVTKRPLDIFDRFIDTENSIVFINYLEELNQAGLYCWWKRTWGCWSAAS